MKVGQQHGSVMSPWLINLFMDEVREINRRVLERRRSMQFVGHEEAWEASQSLSADDTVLEEDSSEKLQ